jgi:hypothetical protein
LNRCLEMMQLHDSPLRAKLSNHGRGERSSSCWQLTPCPITYFCNRCAP